MPKATTIVRGTLLPFALSAYLLAGCLLGEQGPPGPPGTPGSANDDGTVNGGAGDIDDRDGGPTASGASTDAGGPPSPSSKEGTRVKPRTATVTTTTTTSDGAKVVTSYRTDAWFDALRNEPCAFVMAADDKTRCLPTELAQTDYSNGAYFKDAGCTQPLAFTIKSASSGPTCGPTRSPAPPAPKYLSITKSGTTCNGRAIAPLGTKFTPGVNVYFKSGASCFAMPSQPAVYDYFNTTAEIPPTDFVESNTTIVTTPLVGP